MIKETQRNQMNHYIMKEWLAVHPEHKEFVSIMQDAERAFADRMKVEMFGGDAEAVKEINLDIMVGKAVDEKTIYPYLKSSLKNPRIVTGSDNGFPEIIIDKAHTIDLNMVTGVQIKSESIKEGDYSFERFKIAYRLNDLDYMVDVVIKNK